MIKTTRIETPLGEMIAAATKEGICLLEFSDDKIVTEELSELKELLMVRNKRRPEQTSQTSEKTAQGIFCR